ncbi:MAG: sulfotransferase domain-containing protein [Chlamydiales bacterium]|nr:sulfotransferase domain-containing protein [Chlamydiales bacterium]
MIQHLQSKRRVYFTRQHLLPTAHNVRIFHDYFPKFILHLRDPRQVLISWTHFIEKFGQENFKYISSDLHPPASYFSLPLEKKFDWQIAHFLPVVVQWMQAWTRVIDKNEFNILVTRYEDFVQDPERFIRKIAGFYDLKPPHVFLPEKNPKSYFRKGEKDEWKKMLSPRQIQRIHQIIPKSLLRRYNWES